MSRIKHALHLLKYKLNQENREVDNILKLIDNKWPYPNHPLRAKAMLAGLLWTLDPLELVINDRLKLKNRDYIELNDELYDNMAEKIHDAYCDNDVNDLKIDTINKICDDIPPGKSIKETDLILINELLHAIYPY